MGETLNQNAQRQKEVEESRHKAHLRLQMIQESSKITDQSCDEQRRRLDREKNSYKEWQLRRLSLDQQLDEVGSELRGQAAEYTSHQKAYEKLKRQYRKTQTQRDSVNESLD